MITIRNITEKDHAILHSLALKCPPLDVHTQYTYWVNATYFGKSSFLMLDDDNPVGYIMAIDTPELIFIWQIGILPEYRHKGLSRKLIDSCVKYADSIGKPMQVTIAEDNKSSYAAFSSYCSQEGKTFNKIDEIRVTDLDDSSFNEVEIRYEII